MPLNLFLPKYRVDECLEEIRECLERGWTGLGFKTVQFEKAWRDYTGLPHAHFLNSNTSGLHLAFHILKTRLRWSDGDDVITTPMTFVSTNHTILQAGLRPVFADVDEYLCLDPDAVRRKISPRTRAVAFVGLGGNTGHYKEIVDLCQEKGLALILDAAHMAGTRLNGQHVGREADAAVFSFHAVKNLPTADSGMICFKHHEDDQRVRKLTWLGISEDTYSRTISDKMYKWRYDVEEIGFKYHGNSIMAAIGLVQLRYLDEDNAHRRQLAAWYREALSGTAAVKVVPTADGCESSTHLFQVLVRERDTLMLTLHGHEVYPGVHYRDNTDYPMYAFGRGTCPRAHQASKEIMSLPLHLNMNQSNVDFVSSLLTANAR